MISIKYSYITGKNYSITSKAGIKIKHEEKYKILLLKLYSEY